MGSQSRLQVGDKDKISQLPDPVLSHILSFLATKYAVRTSVLCTRWKNIWASVPNLDFELEYGFGNEYMSEHAGFLSFVDRVLYYRDSSDIQRFRLHCNFFPEDLSRLHGWVRTAIRRNVVELDLDVNCSEPLGGRMFELPESLFICKTLVVLKVVSNCLGCSPPKSGCFPNLKFLHIRVYYRDNDMVEKLFSYFPLLEDLTIEGDMSHDISCNFKLSVPASTCDKIDKLNRNFLWGDTSDKRKIHLLKWEKVCKPKAKGGLGLKKTADMNSAMLAKASWRLVQKDEGLWCDVFEKKYLKKNSILDLNYTKHPGCSSTWSSILHGTKLLRTGLQWRVGDGQTIKFWVDNWTGLGALSHLALNPDNIDEDASIQDFWSNNDWDMSLLQTCLPTEIVDRISNIPISLAGHYADKVIWKSTTNGNFSVKSAYDIAISSSLTPSVSWHGIWSFNVPPKIKIFAWLAAHSRLLTNVQRHIRHLTSDPSCKFCPGVAETMIHLFRDCPKARLVWNAVLIPGKCHNFYHLDWNDWILSNITKHGISWNSFNWHDCFLFVCWYIWKWRNKGIFDQNFQLPAISFQIIFQCITEWFSVTLKSTNCGKKQVEAMQWIKPPLGQFKLNVDGSRNATGVSGAGGVLRNWSGDWIQGFSHHIGIGEVLHAEVWGICIGIKMAVDLQIKKLIIESDSALAVALLNSTDYELHPLATIINNCHGLMKFFDYCAIQHAYRERNTVADMLAKDGINMPRGTCFFTSPPAHTSQAVFEDITGVSRARFKGPGMSAV